MLDILAVLVLIVAWIFGGAAFFHSPRVKYKDVLLGWSLLNALAVGVTWSVFSVIWAIERLLA